MHEDPPDGVHFAWMLGLLLERRDEIIVSQVEKRVFARERLQQILVAVKNGPSACPISLAGRVPGPCARTLQSP